MGEAEKNKCRINDMPRFAMAANTKGEAGDTRNNVVCLYEDFNLLNSRDIHIDAKFKYSFNIFNSFILFIERGERFMFQRITRRDIDNTIELMVFHN